MKTNITEQVKNLTGLILKQDMERHRIIEHYEQQRDMFQKKKEQAERSEDWAAYQESMSCHRLCEEFVNRLQSL